MIGKNGEIIGENLGERTFENLADVRIVLCTARRLYFLNCGKVYVSFCFGQNVGYNFVQLDKCGKGGASFIRCCVVVNGRGQTRVEDNISLYKSRGVTVWGNWIEGATGGPDYSGSGIMIDDACTDCIVSNNFIVNTENVGIGIAGGTGHSVSENIVIGDGRGGGGSGDVGIYCANQYAGNPFFGHRVFRNRASWLTTHRESKPYWLNEGLLYSAGNTRLNGAAAELIAAARQSYAAWFRRQTP